MTLASPSSQLYLLNQGWEMNLPCLGSLSQHSSLESSFTTEQGNLTGHLFCLWCLRITSLHCLMANVLSAVLHMAQYNFHLFQAGGYFQPLLFYLNQ